MYYKSILKINCFETEAIASSDTAIMYKSTSLKSSILAIWFRSSRWVKFYFSRVHLHEFQFRTWILNFFKSVYQMLCNISRTNNAYFNHVAKLTKKEVLLINKKLGIYYRINLKLLEDSDQTIKLLCFRNSKINWSTDDILSLSAVVSQIISSISALAFNVPLWQHNKSFSQRHVRWPCKSIINCRLLASRSTLNSSFYFS
jgi:hypothetical protein